MNILSITGADDLTNINDLKSLQIKSPKLEFGILYLLERQGSGRNPSFESRQKFYEVIPREQLAIHICAESAFRIILDENFYKSFVYQELLKAGRIQININSRKNNFTFEEIHEIYLKLLNCDFKIILQYNENSKKWILPFIEKNPQHLKNIDILFDSSLGKAVLITDFFIPEELNKYSFKYGFAGSISIENIQEIHSKVKAIGVDYWLDLESGSRTDNVFDLNKARELNRLINL